MSKVSKDLCSTCKKEVKDSQKGIFCDYCKYWVHLKCTTFSIAYYKILSDGTEDWFCQKCIQANFPFNHYDDDTEFLNCIFMNSRCNDVDRSFISSVCQLDVMNDMSVVSKDIDPDENLNISGKNSNYYTENEFNDVFCEF